MKVLLIRHGMTAGNALRRYIGRTDEPLSPQGFEAAQAACGNTAVDFVYVTPLLRTRQTAAILFPNAKQIIVDDLREMDFGDFEGRSADEMNNDQAYREWVDGSCMGQCPNGESTEAFKRRVLTAFEKTMYNHSPSAETAAFVVHGGTIMAVLEKYARPAMSFYDGYAKNCGGFLCTVSPTEDNALPFVLTDVTRTDKVPL